VCQQLPFGISQFTFVFVFDTVLYLLIFVYFFFCSLSVSVFIAISVMTIGAYFASVNDVEFNVTGYIWMSLNCLLTAGK
jgi:hypothetical protein